MEESQGSSKSLIQHVGPLVTPTSSVAERDHVAVGKFAVPLIVNGIMVFPHWSVVIPVRVIVGIVVSRTT